MELSPVHILQILMCYRDWLLSSLLRRTFIRQRGIGTMDWFLGSHVAPRCTLISLYRKKCCRTCRMITTILCFFFCDSRFEKPSSVPKPVDPVAEVPSGFLDQIGLPEENHINGIKWPWKSWEVTTNHEIWSNLELPCFRTSSYMFEDS